MTVKCRPIYLAREHTVVMLTAVYIAPDANASSTIGYLHDTISNQQSMYPEAVHIISGDFNHANLKAVLPIYSNIKLGFRAKPLPHLGLSDHMSVHLIPAYSPLRKRAPTITKIVKTWSEGAFQQLQDCFETGRFLNIRTWSSTQQQSWDTSNTAQTQSLWTNTSGSIPTQSSGKGI